jgi:hypothetical protein
MGGQAWEAVNRLRSVGEEIARRRSSGKLVWSDVEDASVSAVENFLDVLASFDTFIEAQRDVVKSIAMQAPDTGGYSIESD